MLHIKSGKFLVVASLLIATLAYGCNSSQESSDRHPVLAMGYGASSTVSLWSTTPIQLPVFVIYDDGLILHRCTGTEHWPWPDVCQTRVSSGRVKKLASDIARVEGFGQKCESRALMLVRQGPAQEVTMVLHTEDYCGTLHWWLRMPDPPSYSILVNFISELHNNGTWQSYIPEEVSVIVSHKSCDTIPRWPPHRTLPSCDEAPMWPFEFSPLNAKDSCELVEHSMPTEDAIKALGEGQPLHNEYLFRTETGDLFLVRLRPYLPEEATRASCSLDGYWPQNDTLTWAQ